jgi:hypothetical protein
MDEMKELTADLQMTETGRAFLKDAVLPKPTVAFIPVPEGATNGDVLMNAFPDANVHEIRGHFDGELLGYRAWLGGRSQDYLLSWWNAPYRKE